MKPTVPRILLAAGALALGLLMAGCSANDDDGIVETDYRSLLKLVSTDPAAADSFGFSVALEGDLALVGVPGADGEGSDRGEARLYLMSQGGVDGWGLVKTLAASDAADGDFFGASVAISGDYAVVGAVGENGGGIDQGAAYVFYRHQGGADNWGEVKKLVASDRADSDGFGFAVSIDAATLVVTADGEDGSGTNEGAAYVFGKDQGGADNWGQVRKLVAGEPADDNRFGYAACLQGDLILVGCPFEDEEGSNRGAAYLFSRDLGGLEAWGMAKRITAADPTDSSWFGSAVAIDGPLAVVGEAWNDGGGTNRGAAYVFARDQGGADSWGLVKLLSASDAGNSDFFGYSVALDGTNIVVGAGWAEGGGAERGQAYVYSQDEGGAGNWGEVQRLRASDGQNEDRFGFSAAVSGLYILIGAVGEDGSGTDQGAAYLFKKI